MDDIACDLRCLRQILFFVWVSLNEQKWVTFGERRSRLRPTHEVHVICKERGRERPVFFRWETLGDLQDEPARLPAPLGVALLLLIWYEQLAR